LAVHSGARLGELLELQWRHVDFKRSLIRIEQQWNSSVKRVTLPKSRHAIR
jgi:integrase